MVCRWARRVNPGRGLRWSAPGSISRGEEVEYAALFHPTVRGLVRQMEFGVGAGLERFEGEAGDHFHDDETLWCDVEDGEVGVDA